MTAFVQAIKEISREAVAELNRKNLLLIGKMFAFIVLAFWPFPLGFFLISNIVVRFVVDTLGTSINFAFWLSVLVRAGEIKERPDTSTMWYGVPNDLHKEDSA